MENSNVSSSVDITRRAMLVTLNIRAWSGKLTDLGVSREVSDRHNALEKAGSYRKNLVDPAAVKNMQRSRSMLRKTHYALTVPWDNSNGRLISMNLYEKYRTQLDILIEQHRDEVKEFLDHYENHVEYAKHMLGDMFKESDYPTVEEIRSKFHVNYVFEPLTHSDHLIVEISNSELNKLRRDIESVFNNRINESLRSMYERLNECIVKFNEKTTGTDDKQKIFRDSLLTNLREAVELIPAMNIHNDKQLTEWCESTLKEIDGLTANQLRSTHKDFDKEKTEKVRSHTQDIQEKLAGYFGSTH